MTTATNDFHDRGRKPMAVPVSAMASIFVSNVIDLAYRFTFHAIRWVTLVYVGRALKTFHTGVPRSVAIWWRWNSDQFGRRVAEANLTASERTNKGGSATNSAMVAHEHRTWRRTAGSALGLVTILGVFYYLAQVNAWRPWGAWLAGLATATFIGWVGRDLDQPFVTNPRTGSREPTITAQLLAEALSSIGISALATALKDPDTKKPTARDLRVDQGRTPNGKGNLIRVELPMGVTAHMVMEHQDRFVAALRRAPSQVYLEAADHPHILLLTILDKVPDGSDVPTFEVPERVDIFQDLEVGVNPRGGRVGIRLMFQSLLVGAAPDAGKTSLIRTLIAVATKDPGVQAAVFELKGTGDLTAAEQVAIAYRSGSDPDDLAAATSFLRWVRVEELPRRKKILETLAVEAPERVPDFKLTRALVDDPDVDLDVLVIAIDEFHNLSEDPAFQDEWNLTMGQVREARAAGVIFVLSTQRPDSDAIQPRWRDMFTYRAALRNLSANANAMILGDGMGRKGYDSTKIGPNQQGTAWLRANSGEPQLVRFGYLDGMEAKSIMADTAASRRAAGRLAGHAALGAAPGGSRPDTDDRRFIDHVLSVWPAGVEWMPTTDLAEALAAGLPRYAGIEAGEVTRRLSRDHPGLSSKDKRFPDRGVVKALNHEHVRSASAI